MKSRIFRKVLKANALFTVDIEVASCFSSYFLPGIAKSLGKSRFIDIGHPVFTVGDH